MRRAAYRVSIDRSNQAISGTFTCDRAVSFQINIINILEQWIFFISSHGAQQQFKGSKWNVWLYFQKQLKGDNVWSWCEFKSWFLLQWTENYAICLFAPASAFELGPRFRPKVPTTLTNRRLYCMRRLARPVFFFFFSCFSTLGVWPRTLPARANDPWTLPTQEKTTSTNLQKQLARNFVNFFFLKPPRRRCCR